MSSTKSHPIVVQTPRPSVVAFHPDGEHLLCGDVSGVQRRRIADGQKVGEPIGKNVGCLSVSRDGKWIACGGSGATVWNAETQEKAVEVEDGVDTVVAVDISPDSTRLATCTGFNDNKASIWDILTGERLVGPLFHLGKITGIAFSPDGEHLATAGGKYQCIRVYNSRNGVELIAIRAGTSSWSPLAWSKSGQHIFVQSLYDEIKTFDAFTGSQVAKAQIQKKIINDGVTFALAANGKFLVVCTDRAISFLDASSLAQIGPVVQDTEIVSSVALSPDSNYLATSGDYRSITIRDLSDILPDSYGPFHAPAQGDPGSPTSQDEPEQQHERHSTLQILDEKPPDSPSKQPPVSGSPGSETHSENRDTGFLDVELPSNTPAPLFNYDEPPSPASTTVLREVVIPLPSSLQVTPLPDPLSVTSDHEASSPKKLFDTLPSQGISAFERWLQTRLKKTDEEQPSQPQGRLFMKSRRPINPQFNSQSQAALDTAKKGPSMFAATQRVRRSVAKPVNWSKGVNKVAKLDRVREDASNNRQGSTGAKEVDSVQKANNASRPSAPTEVHVEQKPGDNTVSVTVRFKLPAWMLCFRSSTEDGVH